MASNCTESHIHFTGKHTELAPGISGFQQQYETDTHTYTLTHTDMQTYKFIPEHIHLGSWAVPVLHTYIYTYTQLNQHTVIPKAMRPTLTQTFNMRCQFFGIIK